MPSTRDSALARRTFLQAFFSATVVAATETYAHAADAELFPALDAHTHFYDPTRPQGAPWPGKNDKLLYRKVLPDEFKNLTAKFGVQSTIAVEASPWLEDNQWLLDLAAKDKFVAGVVGNLDPASDEFPRHFERFARDPLFLGFRIGHDKLRPGLENKAFLDNLRRVIRHDRQLDVNGGPDMPADVARLAKLLPELRIVINHAGNLPIDGKAPPAEWQNGMVAVGQCPNAFCKVSALVEGLRPRGQTVPESVDFYRPVLDVAWNAFGPDRLIYGSNWPVCGRYASYGTVERIVVDYFRQRGSEALEKFLSRNAAKAYKSVTRMP